MSTLKTRPFKAALSFGLLVISLGIFGYYYFGGDNDMTGTFTVMTQNIGDLCNCSTPERILENFASLPRPDVLVLQEVGGEASVDRIMQAQGYEYHQYAEYSTIRRDGLAILSDYPLQNVRSLLLPANQNEHRALLAEVELMGRRVLIGSIHFRNIGAFAVEGCSHTATTGEVVRTLWRETFTETPRSVSARELVDYVGTLPEERVILGGDFNTVFIARAIRRMYTRFQDSLWPSLEFLKPSYKKFSFPIGPRVDYILHTAGVQCVASRVIPETAGDHYPVVASFRP